jgi:hypothetical protein
LFYKFQLHAHNKNCVFSFQIKKYLYEKHPNSNDSRNRLFSSCEKKDPTQTRVGFYVLNADGKHLDDEMEYNLYIDKQHKGTLEVSQFETTDKNLLNYQTLDANKHSIEVKQWQQPCKFHVFEIYQ